jgi:hypothetical protein
MEGGCKVIGDRRERDASMTVEVVQAKKAAGGGTVSQEPPSIREAPGTSGTQSTRSGGAKSLPFV